MFQEEGATSRAMTSEIDTTSEVPRTQLPWPACCINHLYFLTGLLCTFVVLTLLLVFLSIRGERARNRRRNRIIEEMLAHHRREMVRAQRRAAERKHEKKVPTTTEQKEKKKPVLKEAKPNNKSERTMKTIWEDQRDTQRIESLGDLQIMEKRLSLAPTPPKNYNKVIAHSPPLEKPDLTKSSRSRESLDYSRENSREYSREYLPDVSATPGAKPRARSVGKTIKSFKKLKREPYSDSLRDYFAPFQGRLPHSIGPTLSVKITAPSLEKLSSETFGSSQPSSKPAESVQATQPDSLVLPTFTLKPTQE